MGPGQPYCSAGVPSSVGLPGMMAAIRTDGPDREVETVTSDVERDWIATLIAVQEGRPPVPLHVTYWS